MFENKEGQNIPDVTFRVYEDNEWKNKSKAAPLARLKPPYLDKLNKSLQNN